MTFRIEKILGLISPCKTFVDVGCDHGYVTKAVIDKGLCERAIITDISEKCLNKARRLLSKEIENGSVVSVVTDGLKGVKDADQVLIAGMGGEEIVKIICESAFLPEKFVLQPMKNTKKVRLTLLEKGYKLEKDFVFYSGRKYYDLILAVRGEDSYTEEELEFGRTNLIERSQDFKRRIREELEKINGYLGCGNLSSSSQQIFRKEIEKLERYL